ncbi:hypothetical protein F5Y15DRAFT_349495 [Xylariaceae sp. FL0016]|nr:hypothetical protein F5Y15DRAFT_349495 [Xylariaceae sp. FL0016]
MYKKHLQAWAKEDPTWRKQKYTKSTKKRRNRTPTLSPTTPSGTAATSVSSSVMDTSNLASPLAMKPDQLLQSVLMNISGMYRGGVDGGRWNIRDSLTIQEPEYDDLFRTAFDIQYYNHTDPSARECVISKSFICLRRAIQDCGFFAMPTIFTTIVHLLRINDIQFASSLLMESAKMASLLHPNTNLSTIFSDLLRLLQDDRGRLEHALVSAYAQCIKDSTTPLDGLPFGHLSIICLTSFYVRYCDYMCRPGTHAQLVAQSTRALEDLSELAEQVYEMDDEAILEILAQWLLLLESDPAMVARTQQVTHDISRRIMSRLAKNGGKFRTNFLLKWSGVRHVLSVLHQNPHQILWLASTTWPSTTSNQEYQHAHVWDVSEGYGQ